MASAALVPAVISGRPGLRLDLGALVLGFLPDLGGRIFSIVFKGTEFLFDGPDRGVVVSPANISISDLISFKQSLGFKIWGGDKTWLAPEKDWLAKTPSYDLDSGVYTVRTDECRLTMISSICRETGLRLSRHIAWGEEGTILLRDEIFNGTAQPVTRGIWNVSQVRRPFKVFFPGRDYDWRSYHHEDVTLPAYEIPFLHERDSIGIACADDSLFKCGGWLSEGKVALVKTSPEGLLFWERSFAVNPQRSYAHGSMVEIFNSDRHGYGELEVHSPLYTLEPGQSASFEQQWLFR